ncbi:MAG TPA: DNA mismatch repair endonuclease MutL [Syntrophales bacterium]|nr:DNA mismatch repair endonuclease MutL [Syntrophales bacterium]HRT71186.1 DNA mismatch repair endonuclease MutL [Syntrophales bacterium]
MSEKIHVLTKDTTDRIAAGEVVERPSSVVKELLENALDAGATEIAIEIEKGGLQTVRVVDNGRGIDQEDVEVAFRRHATSKISGFDDLYSISSFGFRGEALPSIAAVSTVEMVTRRKGAFSGRKVTVENGKVTENREVGCPEGTAVLVRNLFGNVPVRKRFLKKESVEQARCIEVVTRTALACPGVGMRVKVDGKTLLSMPAVGEASERIALALGVDVEERMLPLGYVHGSIKIEGYTSRPDFTRSTTKGMMCYVNGRYVKDAFLNHAVMTAYRRVVEPRRYPQTVLFIEVPRGDVDVNVHPAKMEVRFRNPREVYEAVLTSLARALSGPVQAVTPGLSAEVDRGCSLESYRGRIEEALGRFSSEGAVRESPGLWDEAVVFDGGGPAGFFSSLEYVGQTGKTYLLFTHPDGIVIIDQHAAHERILFEKLRKAVEGGTVIGQRLLVPEVLYLSPASLSLLERSVDCFRAMGLEVEPFGGTAVKVTTFPQLLSHLEPASVIADIIDELAEIGRGSSPTELTERALVAMACKGAVKARDGLTAQEVKQLCRDLDGIAFASTCPHGRPLYVLLDFKELEKMFKRS